MVKTTYDPLRSKEDEEDYIITIGVIKQMIQLKDSIEYIRVKYLNVDDIKDLGWIKDESILLDDTIVWFPEILQYSITKDYLQYMLLYDSKENKVMIKLHNFNTESYNIQIFNGNIKNKSELKVVMKQLKIIN